MSNFEKLPHFIEANGKTYQLMVYPNFMGNMVVSYRQMNDSTKYLCAVCIEEKNKPKKIEDTIGWLNEYIGNERTFPNACKMLYEYVQKNILNGSFVQVAK